MTADHTHDPRRPPRRLLLASRSPRRAVMLREAGFVFEQFDPPYEDPADPNHADANFALNRGIHPHAAAEGGFATEAAGIARALAAHLASAKALSVPDASLPHDAVLLTADTLGLDPEGHLIGTPETPDAALAMLRSFINRTHTIVSAAVLRHGSQPPDTLTDHATVILGPVDDAALNRYIATGDWRGKAGGYNLAERLHAGWPISVEGDPATVMGLPMRQLIPALQRLGVPRHTTPV